MRLLRTLKPYLAVVCMTLFSSCALAQDSPCLCTLKRGDSPAKVAKELGLPDELVSTPEGQGYPFLAFYSERDGVRAYFDESKKLVQLQFKEPSSCLVAGIKSGDLIMAVKEQNGRPIMTFTPDKDSIVWTYSNDPVVLKSEGELFRSGEYVRYWFGRSPENKAVVTKILTNACSVQLRKSF